MCQDLSLLLWDGTAKTALNQEADQQVLVEEVRAGIVLRRYHVNALE